MQEPKNIINIIAIHKINKNKIVFGWLSSEVEKVYSTLKKEISDLQNQFESGVIQANNNNFFNKILNSLRLKYSFNFELANLLIKNSNLTQPEFLKK